MKECVYFIGGDGGPIKIGRATNVPARLNSIQVGNPDKLSILGIMLGKTGIEKATHARFAKLRLNGEWFQRTPEILTFIEEHTQPLSSGLWKKTWNSEEGVQEQGRPDTDPESYKIKIHETFPKLLQARSLTAEMIRRKTGVPSSTLSTWTVPGANPSNLVGVAKVAHCLGVSMHYLLFGVSETSADENEPKARASETSEDENELKARVSEELVRLLGKNIADLQRRGIPST